MNDPNARQNAHHPPRWLVALVLSSAVLSASACKRDTAVVDEGEPQAVRAVDEAAQPREVSSTTVDDTFTESTATVTFVGDEDLSTHGSDCSGFSDTEPSFRFEVVDGPASLEVHARELTFIDTTIAVVGPDGARCNDDGPRSLDPLVRGTFEPGEYAVYVGGRQSGTELHFEVGVRKAGPGISISSCDAAATPTLALGGEAIAASGTLSEPSTRCSSITDTQCYGWIDSETRVCFSVESELVASVSVTSATIDTTALLVDSEGAVVAASDDGLGGTNSEWTGVLQAGEYRLFPGAFGGSSVGDWAAQIEAVDLAVTEAGELAPIAAADCVELAPGETVDVASELARPFVPCASLFEDANCGGDINLMATACVRVGKDGGRYHLEVRAAQFDSTLVLSGPDGAMFDDDGGEQLLSKLDLELTAGDYQVFVGAYGRPSATGYTLRLGGLER